MLAVSERNCRSLARTGVERRGERGLCLFALGDVEYAAVDMEEAAILAVDGASAVLTQRTAPVAAGDAILDLEGRALRHCDRARALDGDEIVGVHQARKLGARLARNSSAV